MMNEPKPTRKRSSRHKRLDHPPPFRLTPRDTQVIKAVNDFRVLRQDQIQRLFFPSRNTAQVRLNLLWQHGFLRREFLPVMGGIQTSPILYVLDTRGADLLRTEFGYESGSLRWSRQKGFDFQFIEHTLGLAEIRIAVELSSQRHGFQLTKWLDEKELKGDYDRVRIDNQWVAILPDAYFVIGVPSGAVHFFLEYDRGSENLGFLKRKLIAYHVYYQSGKCKTRYGTERIRVLTITHGSEGASRNRLENVRKIAGDFGDSRWFWFARLSAVTNQDFLRTPIWWRADNELALSLV